MEAVTTKSPEKTISHGIVAVYKEYLGRGPEWAQTAISETMCVTTLTGSLTKAETSLVANGEVATVRETRRKFQFVMRAAITTLIEEETGRECTCFLSDHDPVTDTAVEMLVFKKA